MSLSPPLRMVNHCMRYI